MVRHCYAFMQDEPPVLLDWAPWNHTAAGNKCFNMVLWNGGSFYIDDGRPTPTGIEATVRNLREIAPTWYYNLPRGFDGLVPYLRADRALRENFFSRLKMMMCAGAALSQPTWDALDEMARETTGERILLVSGLGSTETGPFAMVCTWDQPLSDNCGVPAPGVELKLVPNAGKLEARFKSPSIMAGYWKNPELTAEAFDEEGFYKIGDALRFVDPNDPAKGLLFDGRTAENFKLGTGTWVAVGPVRAGFMNHFGLLARDVVIAGLNRDDLTALIFPNVELCRGLCPDLAADAPAETVLADPRVRERFGALLSSLARRATGSATRLARAILLDQPPSIDRGEMTDKGSINQRAVLAERADLVEELYRRPWSPRLLVAEVSA
jgi:feruloyl-CoA synthase